MKNHRGGPFGNYEVAEPNDHRHDRHAIIADTGRKDPIANRHLSPGLKVRNSLSQVDPNQRPPRHGICDDVKINSSHLFVLLVSIPTFTSTENTPSLDRLQCHYSHAQQLVDEFSRLHEFSMRLQRINRSRGLGSLPKKQIHSGICTYSWRAKRALPSSTSFQQKTSSFDQNSGYLTQETRW